jgi:hypothetical protein
LAAAATTTTAAAAAAATTTARRIRAATFSLLDDALGAIISMEEFERETPEHFVRSDFDPTDPDTFRELLLLGGGGGGGTSTPASATAGEDPAPPMNTDGPVQEWFPLAPPDTFGGFLDRVEVALLQQVRSKSDELFQESPRFALLQEWIQALVGQVVQLQGVVDQLHRDGLTPDEGGPEHRRPAQGVPEAAVGVGPGLPARSRTTWGRSTRSSTAAGSWRGTALLVKIARTMMLLWTTESN